MDKTRENVNLHTQIKELELELAAQKQQVTMLTATVESQHEESAILTLEQSVDKESIKIVKHCEATCE